MARPYSPELFRLGPPAGPRYLLEVLRGNLTRKEAVKEWDAAEQRREESKWENAQTKWPFCMRLQCRMCSDPSDVSTFKQLGAYVPSKAQNLYSTDEVWDEIWLDTIA